MSQPTGAASIRAIADRVLDIIATRLQPAFTTALVRHTAKDLKPKVTEAEMASVTRELPAAAAGHPVTELDALAAGLLAQHRSQAAEENTYRETLAGLGTRATATRARTGRQPAPEPSAAPSWSAVPVGGAPPGPQKDPYGQPPSERYDPCAIAATCLTFPQITPQVGLISEEFVTAAGVLAVLYQYLDRAGFSSAIERAIQQLDSDELCVHDVDLLDALNCWRERDNRVKAPERASLVAKVLGLRDPDLPQGVQPDPLVQGLLDNLLDAINDNCDPGVFRDEPTSADIVRLQSAVRAVLVRLSSSMTVHSTLRVRELQVQFCRALSILRGLASFVRPLCRPGGEVAQGTTATQSEWISVSALNGARLPDGSDLSDAAATAAAWQVVFEWLADPMERDATPTLDVCQAAALLRPARAARCKPAGHAVSRCAGPEAQ